MPPSTRLRRQQDVQRGALRPDRRHSNCPSRLRRRGPVASGTARTGRSRRDPRVMVRGPGRVAGHGGRCHACPSLRRRLFCCHLNSRRKPRVGSGRRRPIRSGHVPRERENDSDHHRDYRRRELRHTAASKEPARPYPLARTYIPAHAIPLRTEAERTSTPGGCVAVHRSKLLVISVHYLKLSIRHSLYARRAGSQRSKRDRPDVVRSSLISSRPAERAFRRATGVAGAPECRRSTRLDYG